MNDKFWSWAVNPRGHNGFILDEDGFVVVDLSTVEGAAKLQPILEHIVKLHNDAMLEN